MRLLSKPLDSGRAVTKRKWSVDRSAGHCCFMAELVQKRMVKHHWPCEYLPERFRGPECDQVRFFHPVGLETPEWLEALASITRAVADVQGAKVRLTEDTLLDLVCLHHFTKDGRLRPGDRPPF